MRSNILVTGFCSVGTAQPDMLEEFLQSLRSVGRLTVVPLFLKRQVFFNGAEHFGQRICDVSKRVHATAIISLMMDSDFEALHVGLNAYNWSNHINDLGGTEKQRVSAVDPPLLVKSIKTDNWQAAHIAKSLESKGISLMDQLFTETVKNKLDYGNALMYRTLTGLGPLCRLPYVFLRLPESSNLAQMSEILSVFADERVIAY